MKKFLLPAATAGLLFGSPAFAHVTVDPKAATAGAYTKLVFRVSHGCEGSPTTAVSIKIAPGVTAVKPQVHPGWKIASKKDEKTGNVQEVTFSGGEIPDEHMDEFGMSVKLPAAAGKTLYFPVEQTCVKGSASWVSDKPDHHHGHAGPLPAPALKLGK